MGSNSRAIVVTSSLRSKSHFAAQSMKWPGNSNNRRSLLLLGPFTIRCPVSELYNDACGHPALMFLGLAAELGQKPICLHQTKSDSFPKPDV